MQPAIKVLAAVGTVAYPLVVYLGFGRWNPAWVAAALAGLMFLRAAGSRDPMWLAAGTGALVLGAAAGVGGSWVPLKLYPVMVSAVLLAVFGASLVRGPTVVERIARLREPQLPAEGVAYTRKVTMAWCGFFVVNGSIAAATALWASQEAWVLYNGLIAYLLIGAFCAIEFLLRRRLRARLAGPERHA